MSDKKNYLLLGVLALLLTSCGLRIEKRHYRKGFYVQKHLGFNKNKIKVGEKQILTHSDDSLLINHQLSKVNTKPNISYTIVNSDSKEVINNEIPDKKIRNQTIKKKEAIANKGCHTLSTLFPSLALNKSLNCIKRFIPEKKQLNKRVKRVKSTSTLGFIFSIIFLFSVILLLLLILMAGFGYEASTIFLVVVGGILLSIIVILLLTPMR